MEPRPLSSSHEAYFNAFQVYRSNSTIPETVKNYSCEAAAHIMQNLTDSVKNSQIFRVLGVGSGDGKHDVEILKIVAESLRSSQMKKSSIHTCIVEPSSQLITDFQRSVSPLPEPLARLADVSFEWREARFEDYIRSSLSHESNCYHMAHFICSLYYMDAEDSLRGCYKHLADGGAIFCLVVGADSFFTKISHKFEGRLKLLPKTGFYTGKDIVAIAERNNWEYEELTKKQYEVDITSCFDKSSRSGSLVLDFFTHQIDFQGTADRMLYNEVLEFLTELSISDSSGRKIITPELAIVVIYK